MKPVIERLFDRVQSSSSGDLDKTKSEILHAAEGELEGIQRYFEKMSNTIVEEAERLSEKLNAKLRG